MVGRRAGALRVGGLIRDTRVVDLPKVDLNFDYHMGIAHDPCTYLDHRSFRSG
jgi:hypothetical protein